MKMFTIAFDIDGTLRDAACDQNQPPKANEHVRTLLIYLSQFSNVLIHVWSGGGELYARQVCAALGISSYVDSYSAKQDKVLGVKFQLANGLKPDITIDDVATNELGTINLITGTPTKPGTSGTAGANPAVSDAPSQAPPGPLNS